MDYLPYQNFCGELCGLGYLRASVASVFLLGEPIVSSLLAFAFPWIAQQPSFYTAVGGAVILTGIFLTTRERA